jgi:hypothetical protein
MRRTLVLAVAALALLGVVTPDAFGQAPTPTFKINGLIDQVGTFARNMSSYDGNLGRNNDQQFYGRTRGRFDFIGEVGKAKGVLGIEIDSYYGQTGSQDSNNVNCIAGANNATVGCATQGSGSRSAFDLNTDTLGNFEIKCSTPSSSCRSFPSRPWSAWAASLSVAPRTTSSPPTPTVTSAG